MGKLFFVLLVLLLPFCSLGQNPDTKPEWASSGFFKEARNTYIESVTAFGYDIESARQKAIKNVVQRRGLASGSEAIVDISSNREDVFVQISDDLTAKCRVISEWTEKVPNGYNVFLLVQTAKNPEYEYDPINLTNKYKFSPRVFIPGMAQLYKGSYSKGIGFIVSEVVCIGGIVSTECLRVHYNSLINSTYNATIRQDYIEKSRICITARNICIAGTVVVYIWNVIDGITAKGITHIEIGENQLSVSPQTLRVGNHNAFGIALNLRF